MKPLEGTVVLDLTHALAGPFCTHQLSMLGARVIKIENPQGGDDFRQFAQHIFDAVNAGKSSVCLDLKHPDALEVLQHLAARADVLVDNFKPGTAAKFGITWESVQRWNPRLIWCSISGFGVDGPWRDLPAVEWSVQAASGLTHSYLDETAHPNDVGLPVLDIGAGHVAVSAILAALLKRGRTNAGERIDVAMMDVALSLSAPRVASGGADKRERRPAVGRFRARDQAVFLMGAHQRWFETISTVVGGDPPLAADGRFSDPRARAANADALRNELERRLAARDAAEWETLFTKAGMPAAAVRTTDEAIASAHVQQRGVVHEVDVENERRQVRIVATPYQLQSTILEPTGPIPALGSSTDSILAELGWSAEKVEQLRRSKVI